MNAAIARISKHAPPGYIHVSEFRDLNRLTDTAIKTLINSRLAPHLVHVGPYRFLPGNIKVETSHGYNNKSYKIVER